MKSAGVSIDGYWILSVLTAKIFNDLSRGFFIFETWFMIKFSACKYHLVCKALGIN